MQPAYAVLLLAVYFDFRAGDAHFIQLANKGLAIRHKRGERRREHVARGSHG